jgi:predicted SprT family Zn-dependent metalloprotease
MKLDLDAYFNSFESTEVGEASARDACTVAEPARPSLISNTLLTIEVSVPEAPAFALAPTPEILVKPTQEAYTELQDAYDFFNARLFDSQLPECLITLQREKRSFGHFQPTSFVRRSTGETTDEISMNPRFFATRSIRDTLSTLVHEMVHLWQAHSGQDKSRKGYHNKEWSDQMERIGLMPSNTGQPGGKKVGEKMSHYIIAGGLFDIACNGLITEAFQLSWMDRHPVVMTQPPVPPETAAAAGMQLPSPTEIAEVEAAEKFVAPIVTPPAKRRRTDGSNRVKYRCPRCKSQVWGKPDLMINCGVVACGGAKFEPATEAAFVPTFAPSPATILSNEGSRQSSRSRERPQRHCRR